MDILLELFEKLFNFNNLYKFGTIFLPLVLAITIHEYGHAYVAYQFGDKSLEKSNRLTLNPLAHIDPIGTLLLPITLYLTSGIAFGWAKPVEISTEHLNYANPGNLSSILRKIALAGPVANFIMIALWMVIFKIVIYFGHSENSYLAFIGHMAIAGMFINASLGVLNLLPILPLDGGKIIYHSLSEDLKQSYGKLEGIGMVIVFVLAVTSMLNHIIQPIVNIILALFATIFSIDI